MNFQFFRFLFFTLFFVSVIVLFSCTKIVTTDIGSGLIPPVDGVTTKDTVLSVESKNTAYDTVTIGISDDHVLGYINDPLFGTTQASVNFQLAPLYAPLSFGISRDNIVLDSVVLCLSYHSNWGDSVSAPLKLHVYSMDPETLFSGDSAYNNTKAFEKGEEITESQAAKIVNVTSLNDTGTTAHYGESTANQLRIRLNNSFGQHIIDADSSLYYQNDSAFYNLARGLIVEPEKTGNDLLVINLLDTSTHLSFYYHSRDLADTLTRRLSPNVLTSASSNTIIRNYSTTQIPSYVSSTNTNDDLIFMQTSPGINATLKISSVSGMPNVIVHRAELLMYQVPDASDQYLIPPNLFLAAYNTDSMRNFAIPYDVTIFNNAITNLTQFGVSPKTSTDQSTGDPINYYYSFDITRYVQSIVTNKNTVYPLKLYAPYNQYIYQGDTIQYVVPIATPSLNTAGVGRIRLGGGSNTNSQYKMKLHIVYSLP